MTRTQTDTRPPRGALAVIAVGLIATIAAALLSTDEAISSGELDWAAKAPMPDSRAAPIPGGGSMQLAEAGLRTTELNAGGYRVYRVASVLKIAAGSAVGQARLRCVTQVPRGKSIVAHTPNSRAAYPRSTEEKDLLKQGDVPESVEVEFAWHGGEFAIVGLEDAFDQYTTLPGVVASWLPYRVGIQGWQWGLPRGRPKKALELGFASFWRTTTIPEARITCTVDSGTGSATVATHGTITGL